ncbi:MAG TPA: YegS/Rv2252/BmrU family lipid kinase, partial [Rhodothermales bacterium]
MRGLSSASFHRSRRIYASRAPRLVHGASTRFVFVVNPTAGRGQASALMARIAEALTSAGATFRVRETRTGDEAHAAARSEASNADVVVAVGGDGTVHHVGKGVVESGGPTALAVIPAGTGNDFARAVGMKRGVDRAINTLLHGAVVSCDYGRIGGTAADGTFSTIFLNAVGIGFDAYVAARRLKRKPLPGVLGYALSAVRELPGWEPVPARVIDEESSRILFDDDLFLMSVGNGPATGGGFRLTPKGNFHDRILDACIVRRLPLWRKLYLLPKAIAGRHVNAAEVTMARSSAFRIECD